MVGLVQLLELYVTASLQLQHSCCFPTLTWSVVQEMRQKVANLGDQWKWQEEKSIYARIEAPSKVEDRLVRDGTYRPAVSEAFTQRNRARIDTNPLAEGDKIQDLFNEEGESIIPLAWEVQMEDPLVLRLKLGRGWGRESRMGGEGKQGISSRRI